MLSRTRTQSDAWRIEPAGIAFGLVEGLMPDAGFERTKPHVGEEDGRCGNVNAWISNEPI